MRSHSEALANRSALHREGGTDGAVASLSSQLWGLLLELLFDPDRPLTGAGWQGGVWVGAQGTEGVVVGAAGAAFQGGGGESSCLVVPAEGARAEFTEG